MFSKRRKTITGKSVAKNTPKIKPAKARRIIRRFHLLIQKRRLICAKLHINIVEDNEELNLEHINHFLMNEPKLKPAYEYGLKAERPDTRLEEKLIKAQLLTTKKELCTLLGYIIGEIHVKGGLGQYQCASTAGQDISRGGDSSKQLIRWCKNLGMSKNDRKTALELGCLNARNFISTSGLFNPVVRIDLNSNDPKQILKQDFMKRPLPKNESEKFDLISCSLVLNFVPTPSERGKMLQRFEHFLKSGKDTYLFVVLPLPCVSNSRYMTKIVFEDIMKSLGYSVVSHHEAKKLVYWLFKFNHSATNKSTSKYQSKKKLKDGQSMNNFSILLPK